MVRFRAGFAAALCLAACSDVRLTAPAAAPTAPAEANGNLAADSAPAAAGSSTPAEDVVATSAARTANAAGPRLTSVGYFSWIYGRPKVDERFIGYVRFGQSVALKGAERVAGIGCSGGFYAVEPRGYVCRDQTVTLDPAARFVAEAAAIAPAAGALPYRYAISNGSPMYARLPTAREQARAEIGYGRPGKFVRLPRGLAAHEELARDEPIGPNAQPPSFALDRRSLLVERRDLVHQPLPLGSMLSFTRSFEAEGRTWLLSTDLTFVPADRVRPFRPSTFRGTRLGEGEAELPIAWFKAFSRPKYRMGAGGMPVKSGAEWPARSWVALTGRRVEVGNVTYHETHEADAEGPVWTASYDATVVEAAERLPFGVKPDDKWLVVSIAKGTLVAYDGSRPVFTTLVSPGRGGIPVAGQDPVQAGTTPLGVFRITFKDRAATMSPDKKGEERTLVIADVPYTQYFSPPFALHAAYWHERFGEPTSAGCLNVSPADAETLFGWTEPKLPEGWAGVTGVSAPENGRASWIVVRR